MNDKAEFRKPLSRSANERISDGHVLRLAYGDANFRARLASYRHTARKRGLDEYASECVVIFVIRNVAVTVA